jgi:hypothetical protein
MEGGGEGGAENTYLSYVFQKLYKRHMPKWRLGLGFSFYCKTKNQGGHWYHPTNLGVQHMQICLLMWHMFVLFIVHGSW